MTNPSDNLRTPPPRPPWQDQDIVLSRIEMQCGVTASGGPGPRAASDFFDVFEVRK